MTFPKPIEAQLATYEALRRIGFVPGELFVAYNHGMPMSVVYAGGKQFAIGAEGCSLSEPEYRAAWVDACAWWNETATNEERVAVYLKFFNTRLLMDLICRLHARGMPLRDPRARAIAGPVLN